MHLFLSPHLDDAVLSCGGTIYQLTQRGEAVTILTLMAGDPPTPLPETPIVQALHRRWDAGANPVAVRRQEDLASAKVIGAHALHRGYPDSVYRIHDGFALYPTEASIFGSLHPHDILGRSLEVETTLFPYVFPEAKMIYAPLGVGHHVDHQIVRDWALHLNRSTLSPSFMLRFYEEYPYTRDQQAIQQALRLLRPLLALRPEVNLLTVQEMNAKAEAIACHRSQISTFWTSEAAMRSDVNHAFCVGDGVYAERYWIIADQRQAREDDPS